MGSDVATKKKKKTKGKKVPPPAASAPLDAFPDFGSAPDPNAAIPLASDALFRFLFHREFPKNPAPTLVRFLAMLVYTTDPQAVSLHDLAKEPFFVEHATLEKILHWSAEDGWGVRREKTWESWHQRVVDASAAAYVAFRDKRLEKLGKIVDKVIARLIPADGSDRQFGLDSKDHEVVRALLGIIKMEHELQLQASPTSSLTGENMEKTVGGKVLSGQAPPAAPMVTASSDAIPANVFPQGLDEDEMRAAAHAVLEVRRNKTVPPKGETS